MLSFRPRPRREKIALEVGSSYPGVISDVRERSLIINVLGTTVVTPKSRLLPMHRDVAFTEGMKVTVQTLYLNETNRMDVKLTAVGE